MANYRKNSANDDDLLSWIIVVIAFIAFVPAGIFLLFYKLMGGTKKERRKQRMSYGPYAPQDDYRTQPNGAQHVYRAQGTPGGQQEAPRRTTPDSKTAATGAPGGARPTQVYQPRESKSHKAQKSGRASPTAGRGLTIVGAIISAVFAMGAADILGSVLAGGGLAQVLGGLFPVLLFLGGGLVTLYMGLDRSKKAKRYRKYLGYIGKREEISISTLAQAMPVSVRVACDDLQDMLDLGILPAGYLDRNTGKLIFSEDGLQDAPPPKAEEEAPTAQTIEEMDNDAILMEIRDVNDAIEDEEMSRKIDRVGEITGKIFAYQAQNPGRASQLRSFLNYYLPTTLKILRAYAQMEGQGIEGENISAAKARIEHMMDKVVEGFEKQLDKLFQDDALDITTDVEVLERMLDQDGLSGNTGGLRLGG